MPTAITTRPQWRKLRKALGLIKRGVPPSRAFTIANLLAAHLEHPRVASMVSRAEALFQAAAVNSLTVAGKDSLRYEYGWAPTQSNAEAAAIAGPDGRAPVRMRATPVRGDWKATAFLLERRFPAEYGSQQPAQVAESVVAVLSALAALRSQPAAPLASFRHVPQLVSQTPATVDATTETQVAQDHATT